MDEINKTQNEQLRSIKLGSCKYGRPPGHTSGRSVENVLSANDTELESWLKSKEAPSTENNINKLCNQEVSVAEHVMNFSELGAHTSTSVLSNYSLFEWSPQEKTARGEPPSYLYLRGLIQRIIKYSTYFQAEIKLRR